jgi:hypothetical protein
MARIEKDSIRDIKKSMRKQDEEQGDESNLYGCPIFWAIVCEETMSMEIQDLALNALKECLQTRGPNVIRVPFMLKALKNILGGRAIVQSSAVITTIIPRYNEDAYYY